MLKKVLLSLFASVATGTSDLRAIYFDRAMPGELETRDAILGEVVGGDLFKLSVTETISSDDGYSVTFTSGRGRVYGSNVHHTGSLTLIRQANSSLLGIVEIAQKSKRYLIAIFVLKSIVATDRSLEQLEQNLMALFNNADSFFDIRVTFELFFIYEVLMHNNSRAKVVRVQVDRKLAIRALKIKKVKFTSKAKDLSVLESFEGKEDCEIMNSNSRFLGLKENSFYFVFENKDIGSKWLRALSVALQVWRLRGIPDSEDVGAVQSHYQQVDKTPIGKIIITILGFFGKRKNSEQYNLLVLDKTADSLRAGKPNRIDYTQVIDGLNYEYQWIFSYDKEENFLTVAETKLGFGQTKMMSYTLPKMIPSVVHYIQLQGGNYYIFANRNGLNAFDIASAIDLLTRSKGQSGDVEFERLRTK